MVNTKVMSIYCSCTHLKRFFFPNVRILRLVWSLFLQPRHEHVSQREEKNKSELMLRIRLTHTKIKSN